MKRKDDDLLRLAFGELAADAARSVEARADAEDLAQIAAFRELHDGLRQLPTPPPDGLSAERLRAAILDREIQARPKPFPWPVLFAPAALAALAAAVLLPRLKAPVEPRLALREGPTHASAFEVAPLPPLEPKAAIVAPSLAVAQEKVARAIASATPRPAVPAGTPRRRVRRAKAPVAPSEPSRELLTLNVKPTGEDEPPALSSTRATPQTLATPPSAVVESASGGETVVIVSPERDLETGAPAATEREATSVLVGG